VNDFDECWNSSSPFWITSSGFGDSGSFTFFQTLETNSGIVARIGHGR
jgi:hypothetical protein